MIDPLSEVVRDPSWLAHRYDPVRDMVHFVAADRAAHRAATFLTDEYLPGAAAPRVIARAGALALAPSPAPVHFIFHSAYCCSTLLARMLDAPGVATSLKEPVILNDLSGWRQRGGETGAIAKVLEGALRLLARPFEQGEAVVIKPSNLINSFAPAMMALRPDARALLLHAPLELFLNSIARKGMLGRLWARELFVKLSRDGLLDYGYDREELLGQTDLQIAALGWLGQHRLFHRMAQQLGPERVRTLDSETLTAEPARALQALAVHFGLPMDAAAADALASGPEAARHSKSGAPFDAAARRQQQRAAQAAHQEEIDKVVAWAAKVAETAGQTLTLPAPLLR
jgi:hypothetical protein